MVQVRARRRYREGDTFDVSLYGEKVRSLIDDHVLALGVDQKIPPVSITAPDFRSKVGGLRSDRAKASEMEHAIRYHIRKHFDEDPAHYAKLSEKLDKILEALKERWDQLALALSDLVDDALKGRQVDSTGLDPQTEAPFYGLLGQELEAEATATGELVVEDAPPATLSPAQAAVLRDATVTLVDASAAVRSAWSASGRTPTRRMSCASGSCSTSTASRSTDTTSSSWIDSPSWPTGWLNWPKPTIRSWWVAHDEPRRPPCRRGSTVAGLDFEVQLSGARRSIGITVDRDGSLIVNAPNDCDEAELAAFAHDKRMWVYKKLAEKDLLLSQRPTKEFVSGEGFAYLGRSHRLLLTDRQGDPVKLERGRLVMRRDIATSGSGGQAMIDWYRTRAQRWLQRRVGPWAQRMGVAPRRSTFEISDTGGAHSARAIASTSTGRRSNFRRHSLTT